MELFDKEVCEVQHEGVRYILRRNPERAEEIACIRKEKKETIEKLCQKKNIYLSGHLRAKAKTAVNEVNSKIKRLKIAGWLSVEANGRVLELKEDKAALAEEGRLDGCYVIKSDLSKDTDKQVIHDRYKDLSEMEEAFRTCKTVMLYLRPWHVWSEKSTRGHALVVMLAYLIIRSLQQSWADFDLTVKEGLKQLTMLCSIELVIKNDGSCHHIPTPCQTSAKLLEAVNVRLPIKNGLQ